MANVEMERESIVETVYCFVLLKLSCIDQKRAAEFRDIILDQDEPEITIIFQSFHVVQVSVYIENDKCWDGLAQCTRSVVA